MTSLDELLVRIRQRAEERQGARGDPGAAGADSGRAVPTAAEVNTALSRLGHASRFDPRAIATSSRFRAGSAIHRVVAAAVARQTAGVLAQVQDFADSCRSALEVLAARVEAAGPHAHPLLAAQVDAALDRLADAEPYGPGAVRDLRARVDALEAALSPTDVALRPWWDPSRWLDESEGPRPSAVTRRASLVTHLAAPVLDVACGRGELLEALRDAGLAASGAETDPRLLAQATAADLAAVRQSPLVALGRAADGELGSVAALGVIECLGTQGAADLVGLAADKLRPGGLLLVESADTEGGRPWSDPYARRPQDPAWIAWLCRQAGFAEVRVVRAADSPAGARLGCYLVAAAGLA